MNTNRYLHVKATGDISGCCDRFVPISGDTTAEQLTQELDDVVETFRAVGIAEAGTWEIMGTGDFGGVLVGRHESPEALVDLVRKLDDIDAANLKLDGLGAGLRWHYLNLVDERDDDTHATTTNEPLQGGFPLWGLTFAPQSKNPRVYAVAEIDEARESGAWFDLDDELTLDRFTTALVDMVLEALKIWPTDMRSVNWQFVHTVGLHGAHVALGEQLDRVLALAELVREMNAVNEHGDATARFAGMYLNPTAAENAGVTTDRGLRAGWPVWEVTPNEPAKIEEQPEQLDIAAMTSEDLLALSTRISEELRERADVDPVPETQVRFYRLGGTAPAEHWSRRFPVILARDENGNWWLSLPGLGLSGQVQTATPSAEEIHASLACGLLVAERISDLLMIEAELLPC